MTNTWADIWELRASLYSVFANILLEPIQLENKAILTKEFWRDFPLEDANPQIKSGLEQLIASGDKLKELRTEKSIETVMVEYTELFIGPGVQKAPPWESFYRTNKRLFFGQPTYEMKEILYKYGLESKKKGRQPEDHIGIELLFISVLTEQLHKVELEEQISIIKEQITFIDNHLLTWIPELCNDAKEHGSVGFYGGLIELVWGTLLWDKELLAEFVTSHKEANEGILLRSID